MTPITMLIKTLNLHTIKLILIPILLSIPSLTPEIKNLREFILWIGNFGGFVGTSFCDLETIVFSYWELIFAIFRKYPVPNVDKIFVLLCVANLS